MFCPGCGEESKYGLMFCEYCDTPVSPSVVETRIVGPFTGWSGETVVTLANGETWRQAEGTVVSCQLEAPRVWLYPSDAGHTLRIAGLDERVPVTRAADPKKSAPADT